MSNNDDLRTLHGCMAVIEKHAAALTRALATVADKVPTIPPKVTITGANAYRLGTGRVFLNGELVAQGGRLVMDTPPAEPPAPVSVTITAPARVADDGDDWFLPRVDDDAWLCDSPPCEPWAVKPVDPPLPPGAITAIDAARKACVPENPAFVWPTRVFDNDDIGHSFTPDDFKPADMAALLFDAHPDDDKGHAFAWPELFNAMPRGLRDSLQQQQADARRFAVRQLRAVHMDDSAPFADRAVAARLCVLDFNVQDATFAEAVNAWFSEPRRTTLRSMVKTSTALPRLSRRVLYAVALIGFGHPAEFTDATRQARRILNRRRRGVAVWATKPSPALAIYAARNRKESAQ